VTSRGEGDSAAEPPRFEHGLVVGAVIAAALLAVLAVLVHAGKLNSVDTYAVRHLMPYRRDDEHHPFSVFAAMIAYHGYHFHLGPAVRLPASAFISSVLIAACFVVLWLRGKRRAALLWAACFFLANVLEVFGKVVITKPRLFDLRHGELLPVGFHHSFPSGHVVRAAVLASVAAYVWPRLAPLFAVWVLAVIVTAELDGIHSPSDIAGALLLAATLVLATLEIERRWARERRGVGVTLRSDPG
jgi:membrane-associated phospholipid phosphatase